jgi:hypothetical protein
MIERQALSPNNRRSNRLSAFVEAIPVYINNPKSIERQTAFSYLRTGRTGQANGASGGGKNVG